MLTLECDDFEVEKTRRTTNFWLNCTPLIVLTHRTFYHWPKSISNMHLIIVLPQLP